MFFLADYVLGIINISYFCLFRILSLLLLLFLVIPFFFSKLSALHFADLHFRQNAFNLSSKASVDFFSAFHRVLTAIFM